MRFLLLIYNEELNGCTGTPELFDEMGVFNAEVIAEGVREAGEALEPVVTARTIRVRGGRVSSTDGRSRRRRSNWAASTCWSAPA